MEVAKTILDQLLTNKTEVWAWGSKNFTSLNRSVDGLSHPALMFSVRTPKVKTGGRVIVSLDYATDTYVVEALRLNSSKEISLGIIKDVYCEELHNAINTLIEDKETYCSVIF